MGWFTTRELPKKRDELLHQRRCLYRESLYTFHTSKVETIERSLLNPLYPPFKHTTNRPSTLQHQTKPNNMWNYLLNLMRCTKIHISKVCVVWHWHWQKANYVTFKKDIQSIWDHNFPATTSRHVLFFGKWFLWMSL